MEDHHKACCSLGSQHGIRLHCLLFVIQEQRYAKIMEYSKTTDEFILLGQEQESVLKEEAKSIIKVK